MNLLENGQKSFWLNFLGAGKKTLIPLVFLFIISLAVPAFAPELPMGVVASSVTVNDITVTINPNQTNCSELGKTFTATVSNGTGNIHSVYEERIYRSESGIAPDSFACGLAPAGWTLSDYAGGNPDLPDYGYCEYKTRKGGPYMIAPGASLNFTFTAVVEFEESVCSSEFLFSTLDDGYPFGDHEWDTADVLIDCIAPLVSKELGTPLYQTPVQTFISQLTKIFVNATDEQDCDLGVDNCTVNYTVDGIPQNPLVFENGSPLNFSFYFNEDSRHDVNLTCVDEVGNSTTVLETDLVETVPPETTKTLGSPKFIDGLKEWITTSTPITLTAVDPLPHPSGVDKTWYLNVIDLSEDACYSPEEYCLPTTVPTPYAQGAECINEMQEYCEENWEEEHYESWEACVEDYAHEECGVDPLWKLYAGPFTKAEESCHVLQFFSVDNLGQVEESNVNCFFVDDTLPVLEKTVGEPNIPVDDDFDYWVTQETLITLACTDQEPHPVNNNTIYWTISVDGGLPQKFSKQASEVIVNFTEDSVHVLEAWCTDALGNASAHDIETFKVDSTPPEITKDMLETEGVDYLGDCPKGTDLVHGDCFVADNGRGGVAIGVSDPDPTGYGCNVGNLACTAEVWWQTSEENCREAQGQDYEDGWCLLDSFEFGEEGQDVLFREDSTHTLTINCWDGLENQTTDVENFLVDSTPPETAKTYGEPYFPEGINKGAPYPHWITSQTLITLTATDAKVGVDKIFWRNKVVDDQWCETETSGCQYYRGELPEKWNDYNGPFTKPEESCHLIEFYSVDLLGNEEEVQRQCVFVDNTPPDLNKTVGDPKVACDIEDPTGCDYYITQQTPIILTCQDKQPHPVNNSSLWYRYRFNDDCEFEGEEGWTEWIDPRGSEVEKTIYFPEDSCHELEYYCEDALGNETETFSEIDIVDTIAPDINKQIVGPQYGDCPPIDEDDDCYIDGVTEILVTAVDPQPHPVNEVTCRWRYSVNGQEPSDWNSEFPIMFPEESEHLLDVECTDALGNVAVDRKVFIVDKTPPETSKRYGQPFFLEEGVEWITSDSNVYLTAIDPEPHPSGVKQTYWRNTLLTGSEACRNVEVCQEAEGFGEWQTYLEPFQKEQESCHLIEYYSVDNVDKTEGVNKQCVFVDNSPPEPVKTVGDPKSKWDGNNSIFYPEIRNQCWLGEDPLECWKVTLLTPVSLGCEDSEPHPVNHNTVCFYVEVDAEDATSAYCNEYDGGYNSNSDGFCCMERTLEEFYFSEETEHNLKYYCEDALGNKGPVDDEKFKVEGTAFRIQLNKKWNLISVPFVLQDDRVEEVFKDVEANIQAVWAFDAETDTWFVYKPGMPVLANKLESIIPGWGYWVSAYADDLLVIGGSLFSPATTPPSRDLKEGWNLIGYYGNDASILEYNGPVGNGKMAYCALWSLGTTILHKGWTSLFTYWEPYNTDVDPSTSVWQEYDKSRRMDPGAGYWINLPEDAGYNYTTTCGLIGDIL